MHRLALVSALGLALTALSACSSGNGADAGGSENVQLVLTDAASPDLAAFEVDVSGLVFHRLDGAEVSVLPRATRVDFVQLDDLRELVGPATLAPGVYTGATMTFDFSTATALVVGSATPASVVDENGQPITGALSAEVTFPTGRQPRLMANRRHVVQLDLDLSQAIAVDTAQNEVTFRPMVAVSFDPVDVRPAAIRGELVSVDAATGRFVVRRLARDGSMLADVTVATSPQSVFQVSGEVYAGTFGLVALEALGAGSRVYVQGALDLMLPGVRAVAIEAGAGVPGGGQDQVFGWIVGRSTAAGTDAELTVLGRSVESGATTRRFHTRFDVHTILGGTKVLMRGMPSPADTDELQVGQLVWVFGTLTGTSMDCGPTAQGIVRVLPTTLLGHANAPAAGGVLDVDVRRIGWLPIGEFDFSVAGNPELDPSATSLDVSNIRVADVAASDLVAASGWFGPVGVMSDPDFSPVRVVDRAANGYLMLCSWRPGTATGALEVGTNALTVHVDAAGVAVVGDGIAPRTLTAMPVPSIAPRTDLGLWFLVQNRGVTLHLSFSEFLADLASRVGAGAAPATVTALGQDDAATQVLTASVASVVLR